MQLTDSLDELRKRTPKYMQLEELREFHNQARAEATREKNRKRRTIKVSQASGATGA